MNRADRRAKAKRMTKGREERRSIARALKTIEIPELEEQPRDPYPALRRRGFVVAGPKIIHVPEGQA